MLIPNHFPSLTLLLQHIRCFRFCNGDCSHPDNSRSSTRGITTIAHAIVTIATLEKKASERLELLQGTLDMMVMQTLLGGKANGYEIAKAIGRLSDNVLTVDHGSLYPALHRLEKAGLIAGAWEVSTTNRRARFYRLTPAGRKQLVHEKSKWEQMASAVTRVMGIA
jgi:PadR family transcriptional regulator, regulatory protein PadR